MGGERYLLYGAKNEVASNGVKHAERSTCYMWERLHVNVLFSVLEIFRLSIQNINTDGILRQVLREVFHIEKQIELFTKRRDKRETLLMKITLK